MRKDDQTVQRQEFVRDEDGVYRWEYERSLFHHPVILFTVWKILTGSVIAVWLFVVFVSRGNVRFFPDGFLKLSKVFVLLLIGMWVLGLLAYLLYSAVMKGKYCVLFEMDEKGIRHTQVPKQFQKTQVLSGITVLAGMKSGKIGTVGTGLLSGSRFFLYTPWTSIKRIVFKPKANLILLYAPFNNNQIYVSGEEFDFVQNYVISHCGKARIR